MTKPRRAAMALALCCASMTTACQTLSALAPQNVELRSAQALYVAEAAFAGASTVLEQASDQHLLEGARATRARDAYDKARSALLAAREARSNGDEVLELTNASSAAADAGQVEAIVVGDNQAP